MTPSRSVVWIALVVAGCVGPAEGPVDTDAGLPLDGGRDAARPRDASIFRLDAALAPPLDASPEPDVPLDAGPGRLEQALGPAVSAATPPPPLSGGTLIVTHGDGFAVASDPDRDRVMIVDLTTLAVGEIALTPGDEPGRSVEDGAGRVHVALRRGGSVVTIDLATQAVLGRRAVCPAPRGIAYDAATDRLHVACASGELVTLPPTLDPPTRVLRIDDDLRDVVVVGGELFVSRFRSAQVLVIDDATGTLTHRISLGDAPSTVSAAVAWRMIPSPLGGVAVVYQLGRVGDIDPTVHGGYGGFGCNGVVLEAVSEIRASSVAPTPSVALSGCAVLPVDAAFNALGTLFAVAAGAAPLAPLGQIIGVTRETSGAFGASGPLPRATDPGGRLIAIAATTSGIAVTQVREPSGLWIERTGDAMPTYVSLGGVSVLDSGFEAFHSNVGIGLACASCHPEGGDDGRVWSFAGMGPRRTMSLRGGILGTEPFHWTGDLATFDALMDDVFVGRMAGGAFSPEHTSALAHWIDASPLLPARSVADPAAVARGQLVFERDDVGCTGCHSGARFSNETTTDVGTAGLFQVPSLRGLAYRAPYMHTGCAGSLRDRFTESCGGTLHGDTSALSAADIDDLVAYLETL